MSKKSEQRAEQRALIKAGKIHVSGWISARDVPRFEKLVAEGKGDA